MCADGSEVPTGVTARRDLTTTGAVQLNSLAPDDPLVDRHNQPARLAIRVFCTEISVEADPPDDDVCTTLIGVVGGGRAAVAEIAATIVAGAPQRRRSPACGPLREALCRTRTGDPFLTMEVLYQLS